jgi:hypothetical protein
MRSVASGSAGVQTDRSRSRKRTGVPEQSVDQEAKVGPDHPFGFERHQDPGEHRLGQGTGHQFVDEAVGPVRIQVVAP